jgi:uncharacterized membrane protein YbhN (UPF0104 family)
MSQRTKVWLSRLVRYGVCAAAIIWLWFQTDWIRLGHVLSEANWSLVLVGLLAFGPCPIGLALRLKLLLAVQNVPISMWSAIRVTFAGNFIINALPLGTPGGDAVKAYYVTLDTPHKHEAVTAVFFDRVIGVLGLVIMSGVMVVCDWHNPAFRTYGRPIAMAIFLFMLGMAVLLSRRLREFLRLDRIISLLPLAEHVQRIDRALLLYRSRPFLLAASLVLTFLLQFACIVSLYLTGWALGLVGQHPGQAFFVYLGYVPIALLMGALPIGIMEVTFRQLLADAAHLGTPEAAVSLSILCRLIQLVWSLPGVIVVLRTRPRVEPDSITP